MYVQPLNPSIMLLGWGKSSQRSRQGSLKYPKSEVQVVQRAQGQQGGDSTDYGGELKRTTKA